MLSYYIVDISYATNMFFILTIMLSYKRSRKTLPIAFVLGLGIYVILDYICMSKIPGLSMQFSFVIAGYFEMFSTFGMLCLFTRGNIWRNYTFLILAFVLINALVSLIISFDSGLEEIFASYLVNGDVPVYAAVAFCVITVISGIIVTLIMSKLLSKEYKGNGRIYMIFSLLYALLGIVQVVFKTSAVEEGLKQDVITDVPKLVFVLIGVTTFYVFGLLYYRTEKKSLIKENKKLMEYIQSNDARYQKLVEDNKKLTAVKTDILEYAGNLNGDRDRLYKQELQDLANVVTGVTLTGNLVIDSLIKDCYDKAKNIGVSCEIIPGNVTFDEDNIISYATIIENLLLIARECASKAKNKWMYVSFKQNGELVLVKTEFSKEKKDKLHIGGNIFQKQTASVHRLKLIKSISEFMSGTINIVNNDEEGSIGVLLNNM